MASLKKQLILFLKGLDEPKLRDLITQLEKRDVIIPDDENGRKLILNFVQLLPDVTLKNNSYAGSVKHFISFFEEINPKLLTEFLNIYAPDLIDQLSVKPSSRPKSK